MSFILPTINKYHNLYKPDNVIVSKFTFDKKENTQVLPVVDSLNGDNLIELPEKDLREPEGFTTFDHSLQSVGEIITSMFKNRGDVEDTDIIEEIFDAPNEKNLVKNVTTVLEKDGKRRILLNGDDRVETKYIINQECNKPTTVSASLNIKWDNKPVRQHTKELKEHKAANFQIFNNETVNKFADCVYNEDPFTIMWISAKHYNMCIDKRGIPNDEYAFCIDYICDIVYGLWAQKGAFLGLINEAKLMSMKRLPIKHIPFNDQLIISKSTLAPTSADNVKRIIILALNEHFLQQYPRRTNLYHSIDYGQTCCITLPKIWKCFSKETHDQSILSPKGPCIKNINVQFLQTIARFVYADKSLAVDWLPLHKQTDMHEV